MSDFNSVRRNHEFMSINIYNFLDNILALVRPSETLESESQNCDQITTQVKPGGYSEDIFIFLSHRDKEEYNCSVCYSVVKDAHQCINGHKFCYSCIYVWSTCNRAGADCCPVCRCDGRYARNDQINEKIGRERVKCVSEGCNWRGHLRDYSEHQHRMYDFRELNTSIELPFIKPIESINSKSSTNLQNNNSSNGLAKKKNETCDARGDFDQILSTTTNMTDEESSVANIPGAGGNVTVPNMVPRRLQRNTETHLTNRATILRPTLNNVTRSTILSTRCPTYRHSSTNQRLARLPRNIVNGNLNNRENNPITIATTSRSSGLNESTQTSASDSSEVITESNSLNIRESPRDLGDTTNRSGANRLQSPRNVQLPAINHSNVNNVNCDRDPLEYRRLAPTFASRRGNLVMSQNEGREQLAMMLILLTSDLEERVSLTDQYHDQATNNQQVDNQTNTETSVENTSSSNLNRSTGRLGRSRLQEFRNLNRRLSEVANSLDRLIVSTSRDDERYHNFYSGTPEGSTSNVTSDADEDVNNNGSYR